MANDFYINASYVAREVSRIKKAVFKQTGERIAAEIEDAFETLLLETPQWTGTLTASWNIELAPRIAPPTLGEMEGVRKQSERKKTEALQMGHHAAVNIAKSHAAGALDKLSTEYTYSDIYIYNNTPHKWRMEYGPLRSVNMEGLNAHLKFINTLQNINFDPIDDEL